MVMVRILSLAVALAAPVLTACRATGSDATSPAFDGETIRIVVGNSPGGTYDLHARLVARYLGSHLPGQPTVVVENMLGGGGVVAAAYLAGAAAPDGLTIGLLAETDVAQAIQSGSIERFQLLGSPAPIVPVLMFSKQSGIANLSDWRRAARPPRFASSGPRALTYVVPKIVSAALGLPVTVIPGYAGTSEMRLAMEGGEVDAVCVSWDSVKTIFGDASGAAVVMRFSAEPLGGADAPDALSLAPDAAARELLETSIYAMTSFARFYAVPRNVPPARLTLLRQGLADTLADPGLLADAGNAGLLIAPITADTLQQTLNALKPRAGAIERVRTILSQP